MNTRVPPSFPELWRKLHLRRALSLVWKYAPGWTLLLGVLVTLQAVLPLAALYLLKLIMDRLAEAVAGAAPAAALPGILVLIGLAAAIGVAAVLLRAVSAYATEAQTQLVTDRMLDLIYEKSVTVDYGYYEDPRYYDTLHRTQQEAPYRPTRVTTTLSQLAQNGITAAGILALLATVNWWIGVLLLLMVAPALWLRVKHSRRLNRWLWDRASTQRQSSYTGWLMVDAEHAKELRLFELGDVLRQRVRRLRDQLRGERLDLARRRSAADAAAQVLATLFVFGTFAYIAALTVSGALSIGDLVLYFGAVQRGQAALEGLFGGLASLYEHNLFLSTLDEFLSVQPALATPPDPLPVPAPLATGISCHGVTFRYPHSHQPALQDIRLEVGPGRMIALVGPNGSGKTTLVKLLCRLYDPDAGAIRLDGIDIRRFRPTSCGVESRSCSRTTPGTT